MSEHSTQSTTTARDWRRIAEWDWVWVGSGERLHALADVDDDVAVENDWGGPGVTACGRHGWLSIPGLFSRMGTDRCSNCCKAAGMPLGVGSPKNDDECRPLVERRLRELGLADVEAPDER
jgi:hypothetical protein